MGLTIAWNGHAKRAPEADAEPLMGDAVTQADPLEMTLAELEDIYSEIDEQPTWRATADKEMDYADGKQLDSDLLQKQAALGIPPAVEDLIGPALRSLAGYEVSVRTDWRVTPDGPADGQDVADALNYRLNQAERQAKADRACSEAFRAQAACGIGWVEVTRESNPFRYPYKCIAVHRNEIHWDMTSNTLDLSDARWLKRARWVHPSRLRLMFPEHAALIEGLGRDGSMWWGSSLIGDGGQSTGLRSAWGETHQTIDETRWYNSSSKELCLSEIWYRRWVPATVLKLKDGRAVEYDEGNLAHAVAIESGSAKLVKASIDKIRRAYWIGPHRLIDEESPYPHNALGGYVPFFGFREDNTGIPYGYVRGMKYPQDSLNSGVSKLRWGMAVARVERTKGAVAMPDAIFRREVARSDADIVLDPDQMARPGARFEVKRDYQLTDQHHQMLMDNRASIERVSAITASIQGRDPSAQSGQQESMRIEQSNQSLADLMDNFRAARSQVGELLLSLIIEDIGQEEEAVIIEGDALTDDRTVMLNHPETDELGMPYISNDIQRIRLKVALEEVPSTSSFRAQQLAAMSEAIKALPAQYQAAAMPFLASLMDVPFKRDLVEALRAAGDAQDPATEIKAKELELKASRTEAEIKEIEARAVQIGVQAAFSAMQAGAQVATMPQIAPIADSIMQSAGYQTPNPAGVDPNYPVPGAVPAPVSPESDAQVLLNEAMRRRAERQNTSPQFPPIPQDPASSMQGIETSRIDDNLQAKP
jgi:hypothetical protein